MARFRFHLVIVSAVVILNKCNSAFGADRRTRPARLERPSPAEHDGNTIEPFHIETQENHHMETNKPLIMETFVPPHLETTHDPLHVGVQQPLPAEPERPDIFAESLDETDNEHEDDFGDGQDYLADRDPMDETHFIHIDMNVTQDPTSHSSDAQCPSGYHAIGQECFFFSNKKADWNTARIKCETMGAKIAHVTDFRIFKDYVIKHFKKTIFWLGAYIPANEDDFVWVSGAKLPQDIPWGPFNPSGNKQTCLSVGYDEAYDDDWCCRPRQYVCSTK